MLALKLVMLALKLAMLVEELIRVVQELTVTMFSKLEWVCQIEISYKHLVYISKMHKLLELNLKGKIYKA